MGTFVVFEEEARRGLERGMSVPAGAASGALSRTGRNLVPPRRGSVPTITEGGIRVGKPIELDDPLEKLGVELVKKQRAASKFHGRDALPA